MNLVGYDGGGGGAERCRHTRQVEKYLKDSGGGVDVDRLVTWLGRGRVHPLEDGTESKVISL